MEDAPVSVVMIGLGGYGEVYLADMLENVDGGRFRIVAGVDPAPERCRYLAQLRKLQIPLFRSVDDFWRSGSAELAVISSPIHYHCEQTCAALAHGAHVLCEKPAAATVQEVDRMMEARDHARRFVAIGFQWSFSPGMGDLKKEIRSGRLGAPKRIRSLTLWPRDQGYYARNNWAGRRAAADGRWILDSPANNAMAHDLHNMLYLLGDEQDRSADVQSVAAEAYRANPVETFDTVAARIMTARGAEVLFLASHAVRANHNPRFDAEFENAVLEYPGDDAPITVRFHDGKITEYPSPATDAQTRKLWMCVDGVRSGGPVPCGPEAARAHTLCVNGIHQAVSDAAQFPEELIATTGDGPSPVTYVNGLDDDLRRCYERWALPGEAGLPWATRPGEADLTALSVFAAGPSDG